MSATIRAKVDSELMRRVGTWFTVRELQEKLRVKASTLKPLIMKYAREKLLRRRSVKGTARSVQFTPAAGNQGGFKVLLNQRMPYRNLGGNRSMMLPGTSRPIATTMQPTRSAAKRPAKRAMAKKATKRPAKTARRTSRR